MKPILCVNAFSVYSIVHHSPAVCQPPCQNGGNCTFPGQCSCLAEWEGTRCEQGELFSEQILHMALNWAKHLYFTQLISAHFAHTCTISLLAGCTPPCANGGSCISPGICSCTTGWTGERCRQGTIFTLSVCNIVRCTFLLNIHHCSCLSPSLPKWGHLHIPWSLCMPCKLDRGSM